MSDSLFLDPFAVPSEDDEAPAVSGPDDAALGASDDAGGVVAGTVVSSAPAASQASHHVTAVVPLDLDQAVGAFVDDTHLWWPRDLLATGPEGHVYFGDGALLEEASDDSRTAGTPHEWATVVGAAEATLELDWWGGRRGSQRTAVRLYLSWTVGTVGTEGAERAGGGAELSVRGNEPTSWTQDWTAVLGAFAHFPGGRVTGPAEVGEARNDA